MSEQSLLEMLPSPGALIETPEGVHWRSKYPRKIVAKAIRTVLNQTRAAIINGQLTQLPEEPLYLIAILIEDEMARLTGNPKQGSPKRRKLLLGLRR